MKSPNVPNLLKDKRPNVAILLARIAAGGILFYEGLAKMIVEPSIVVAYFASHGFPFAELIGPTITVFEFAAGILIVVGIYSRQLAFLAALEMIVATVVNLLDSNIGGAEVSILMFAGMASVYFVGDGRFSIRHILATKINKTAPTSTDPAKA
ncbi:MAG: DoxX family protein [Candidatus Andersenbacteria bacterium]|nr:DoxX family protein [Candidatus Andersenbacteria bacterium]